MQEVCLDAVREEPGGNHVSGVMGYYLTRLAGTETSASSWEMRGCRHAGMILVLDCKGASLSAAAMASGFLHFRKKPLLPEWYQMEFLRCIMSGWQPWKKRPGLQVALSAGIRNTAAGKARHLDFAGRDRSAAQADRAIGRSDGKVDRGRAVLGNWRMRFPWDKSEKSRKTEAISGGGRSLSEVPAVGSKSHLARPHRCCS
ncbi:MAG: hypothetical protein ACLTR6_06660 [Clostridium fessum]